MLVNELLKKLPEVPTALRELISGGAEGNPFYMEELVRMLIDQGAIDASSDPWRLHAERLLASKVPSTLTGVLQARLDGLPADERLTLQEASVIGQIFWDRALLALDEQAEATLPRLVQRELALPRHDAEADGLREYAFKHALLHQVTYGTVLKHQRKTLHGKLARWLAAQSEGDSARAGDFLGLTAQHYEEAGDEANAAAFHVRAAEYAAGRLAHAAALEHVRHALALLDRAGDNPSQTPLRWRLLLASERTLAIQGERERQRADLDAMDRVAEVLRDDARRAYAAFRRACLAMVVAEWNECEQSARRAVALALAAGKAALASQAGSAESADADNGLHELRLNSLRLVSVVMRNQGRLDAAQALLQETLDEATARGLLNVQGLCVNSLAVLAERRGDLVRLLELSREALNLTRQAGDRRGEAVELGSVGNGWLKLGDLAAARRDLEEGLRLTRQNGDRTMECVSLCNLSVLALWQGDDVRALALARGALDTAVSVQARDWEALTLLSLGAAEASLGRLAPAALAHTQARHLAQEIGSPWHFDASAGLARVAMAQGDIGGALREVNLLLSQTAARVQEDAAGGSAAASEPHAVDASEAAASNFDGAQWPRLVEFTVYRVLAAAGDPRAAVWLQRAHAGLMSQAETISDPGLRQMFLTNIPHHREIVALWRPQ